MTLPLLFSFLKTAVGPLDCVGLNDWIVVNNGLEMVGKKISWPYLRHHPTVCVDGQRTVSAGPDSNQILLNGIWKCAT